MKLVANKQLLNGTYNVSLAITEILPEERTNILKFGAPLISIAPQRAINRNVYVTSLPLHEINHSFSFGTETQATNFINDMKNKISSAVGILKSKKDEFSKQEEYEL